MLYSKSAEYAIQAMIYLAEINSPKPVMISKIAQAYDIPQQFLAKIAQTLVKQRLMIAIRGRKGGVKLARPAKEIYLNQIANAIDGPPPEQEQCIIGLDYCSDEAPCPLHEKWEVIREDICKMIDSDNLEHLAQKVIEKRRLMQGSGPTT